MITRAERRREERKNKKLFKWLMSLNREQKMLLTEYCTEATKSDILAFGQAFERVLRVEFQKLFNDEIEAEEYLSKIIDLVEEEGLAMKKLLNGSVEYVANLKQCKGEIAKRYEDLKATEIKEKEIWNQLKMDYPKFTLSAIKNVIAEYKRDKKKAAANKSHNELEEEIELNPNMDTEEIAKVIVNCGGIPESENKADTEENEVKGKIIRQEEKESTEEAIDKQNEEIKSSLVEVTQVREFVGKFGSYQKLQGGVVKSGNLEFSNANDIEECKKQIDEELEAERKEFEKKQAEKRVQSLGRLGEIMSLLSM